MRNVAFSMMLIALASLQIAVVSTELTPARATTVAKSDTSVSTHAKKVNG